MQLRSGKILSAPEKNIDYHENITENLSGTDSQTETSQTSQTSQTSIADYVEIQGA